MSTDISKARLEIGGLVLVLDTHKAMELFEMINRGGIERVDYDWISSEKSETGKSYSMHYLVPINQSLNMRGLSPDEYSVWKVYTAAREEKNK